MTTVTLKVAGAFRQDVGRGKVRIDRASMNELGITTGDYVKIIGKKQAVAQVWPAIPDDEGKGIIRIDGIIRQNAGVGIGDNVKVEKTEVKQGARIVLAPKQPLRFAPGFEDYIKRNLLGLAVMRGNMVPIAIFGKPIPLVVTQVNPQGPVVINEETEIQLREEPVKELGNVPTVTYDDIGGLKEEIAKIREMVELPLRHPELFDRLGIEPPKGVLLYGPPGTGKTLLAKAVANESDANFFYIGGPEVVSKWLGVSDKAVR